MYRAAVALNLINIGVGTVYGQHLTKIWVQRAFLINLVPQKLLAKDIAMPIYEISMKTF